jgi:putative transposase
VKYGAISEQSGVYPVRSLCRLLEVSVSGYYAWRGRSPSVRNRENEAMLSAIRHVHETIDVNYGSPRMRDELMAQGFSCSVNRVARLMARHGLEALTTTRYRSLSKASRRQPPAPNLLNRQFTVSEPNRVWAADITYIPTAEGHLYLAVLMDLYNREIVGTAMSGRLGADLVSAALKQAVARRRVSPGLIHHSDQDRLYSSTAYRHLMSYYGIVPSMSRKGNYLDNACVESFFGLLKREKVGGMRFRNRDQAHQELFKWIEVHYNRVRRHTTLGGVSPVQFASANT